VAWFPFRDEIFADSPNVCGLLRCRLVNTSDEEMTDNNIVIWPPWNTAPGGKLSSFDVDENWLPIYNFIKGRGIICLDDKPLLFEAVIDGSNGRMVELPAHEAGIRMRRRQGQDNTNDPQDPLLREEQVIQRIFSTGTSKTHKGGKAGMF